MVPDARGCEASPTFLYIMVGANMVFDYVVSPFLQKFLRPLLMQIHTFSSTPVVEAMKADPLLSPLKKLKVLKLEFEFVQN